MITQKSPKTHLFVAPKCKEMFQTHRAMEGNKKLYVEGAYNLGLTFQLTNHNLDVIARHFPNELDVEKYRHILRADTNSGGMEKLPTDEKLPSRWYQVRALEAMQNKSLFGLFMDMRTGKTKVAIDWICQLHREGKVKNAIVVCPKSVIRQWVNVGLPTHCSVDYNVIEWPFKTATISNDRMNVLVINYDAVSRAKNGKKFCEGFLKEQKPEHNAILLDESADIKTSSSQRHKAIMDLRPLAKYRLLMSGTPQTKDPTDIWGQFRFLSDNILGYKYKTGFQRRYCLFNDFGAVIGSQNVNELKEKMSSHIYRITRQEIGRLPPVYQNWKFKLSPKQKQLIKTVREEFIAFVESGQPVEVPNIISARMKIQQITNGFIIHNDRETIEDIVSLDENPRILALKDYCESLEGSQAIIWTRFNHDQHLIANALDNCIVLKGNTNQREEAKERFFSKDVQFIIANPRVGGIGQDFHYSGCINDIFYSNSFDWYYRQQAEARLDYGVEDIITHTDLIGIGGVDASILANLTKKTDMSNEILSNPIEALGIDEEGLFDV